MQIILNVYSVNRWSRSRRSRWIRRSELKRTGYDSLRKSDDSCRRWGSSSWFMSFFMNSLHRNSYCFRFMKECVEKCKSQPQNAWNQNELRKSELTQFAFWRHVPGVIVSSLVHVIQEKIDVCLGNLSLKSSLHNPLQTRIHSLSLKNRSKMGCKHCLFLYFYASTHFLLYAYDAMKHHAL